VVAAAFVHDGVARRLVHLLKYGAMPAAAEPLAGRMAILAPGASALVPVPRAVLRRWRHGIDPADELARTVALRLAVPVVRALAGELWHPRRAGTVGRRRGSPTFRRRGPIPPGAVLVDDVVTTGTTLAAARRALGHPLPAIVATVAPSLIGGRTGGAGPDG